MGIDAKLYINHASNLCLICATTQNCKSCDEGIPIFIQHHAMMEPETAEMEMIHNSSTSKHVLLMESNDTILARTKSEIFISPRPVGSGLTGPMGSGCIPCPETSVNLYEDDNECHSCVSLENTMFNIEFEYNSWITIAGYSEGSEYVYNYNNIINRMVMILQNI